MKATIIGSDLLQTDNSVKFLEINTNTTIYNQGADFLDYTTLFNVLTSNNITEFHFIWTEGSAYTPLYEPYRFKDILEQKCGENNILFVEHMVPFGSVTVPFIEDADNKFILRQSFDTTALLDETYCVDKFEFFSLISGSQYTPKTHYTSDTLFLDSLDEVDYTTTTTPNVLIKARYPSYDEMTHPALYRVTNSTELTTLKNELESNFLVQEFIFSEDNLIDERYSIIRSIDIVYGPSLEVVSLGGYTQSTFIKLSFMADEFVSNTNKLNQKSRYKYITKELGNFAGNEYHADSESVILDYTGSLLDVDNIRLGDYVRSINYTDFNGNNASKFDESTITTFGWDSTLVQDNATLTQTSSSLEQIVSASVDTIYIKITLEDGRTWDDAPSCTYYIEESGSNSTKFEKVNKMFIGDKLIVTDSNTNELTAVTITGLEMVLAQKTIYNLNLEPSDLFLVDFGEGDFGIMHNACWCPWVYCGYYCHSWFCRNCGGNGPPKV